jgi:hypothetical protein
MTAEELDAFLTVAQKHGVQELSIGEIKVSMNPMFARLASLSPQDQDKLDKQIADETDKPEISEEDLFAAADRQPSPTPS